MPIKYKVGQSNSEIIFFSEEETEVTDSSSWIHLEVFTTKKHLWYVAT